MPKGNTADFILFNNLTTYYKTKVLCMLVVLGLLKKEQYLVVNSVFKSLFVLDVEIPFDT